MGYLKRLKDTAKTMPLPVWVAGVIIPGGLTILAAYMAYKATKPQKESQDEGQRTDR